MKNVKALIHLKQPTSPGRSQVKLLETKYKSLHQSVDRPTLLRIIITRRF